MEEKIRQIMASVFLIDKSEIITQSSPDTIPAWDSIGHLNLVTALEEEFGITFNEEQMIQMLNFGLVVEVTNEAIKAM